MISGDRSNNRTGTQKPSVVVYLSVLPSVCYLLTYSDTQVTVTSLTVYVITGIQHYRIQQNTTAKYDNAFCYARQRLANVIQ